MTETKTLFDRPLSHTGDPETSYIAADRMIKSGALSLQEQGVYNDIRRYIIDAHHKDFTPKELAHWQIGDEAENYHRIERRLSGLYHKGKIARLNTIGEVYQENKGQKLMKRNGCAVWAVI
ncbi:hypothetical protein LCGC14_0421000 [marine sediment metagenome]|uniref:Uncharacterized protein n=1 Tax=marine sediment metagenome TaxID=412755 RepID=A0A0F9W012_9ZZZZ